MLFFGYAMFSAVDWLYSKIPVRFPDLRISMAEGGIGWVPGLLDRLSHVERYQEMYGTWTADIELTPSEVLRRNFWFCALDDPTTMAIADSIGFDHIMLETDYPHLDASWPNSQQVVDQQIAGLSPAAAEQVSWRTAAELFHLDVPPAVAADPEIF